MSPAGNKLPIERLSHTGPVTCCQFSPDGKRLLTAVRNTLHVWDAETGEPTVTGIRDPNTITRFAVSPDGKLVATITPGAVAKCWRLAIGSEAAPPLVHDKTIDHVAFSSDGSRLVTATKDGKVHFWDTATWQLIDPLLERVSRVRSMDFSSDGRLLAVSSVDGSTRLIDLQNAAPRGPPVWHQGPVNCVRFRPGSHMAATASQDGTARIWREDWPDGALRWTHSSAVFSLAFHPGGALLAVGGNAGDVGIWDVTRRRLQRGFTPHRERVTAVAFSPDGKLLATSSEDCTARFWNVNTGEAVGDPLRHAEGVKALAFNPDGTLLATAGNEGSLKLWPVGLSHEPIELFRGASGKGVKAVAFSPDGRLLAFTTNERRTEIWDVATRQPCGPATRTRRSNSQSCFQFRWEMALDVRRRRDGAALERGDSRTGRSLDAAHGGDPRRGARAGWQLVCYGRARPERSHLGPSFDPGLRRRTAARRRHRGCRGRQSRFLTAGDRLVRQIRLAVAASASAPRPSRYGSEDKSHARCSHGQRRQAPRTRLARLAGIA